MRKALSIAALTLLLGTIFPASAHAQSYFGWDLNRGFGRDLSSPYRFRHNFRRVMPNREARMSNEIASLRTRISRELADGVISEMRAERLNARLNNIEARLRMMAYGGLSPNEFAMLQTRLNDIRVAVGAGAYY